MRAALPRRADRAGDRAAAAGAHAARRRGRPPARRGGRRRRRTCATSCRPVLRRFRSPHDPVPRTHLLSNGRYAVMLTAAGSGYSRWRDLAVTRWREDATRDCLGQYVFLRDVAERRGLVGGLPAERRRARQLRGRLLRGPRRDPPPRRRHRRRRSRSSVSPEDDAEVRRVSLTNHGTRDARDRAHVLRRGRARAARRRRRAPGLLEPVRPDRVRRRRSARSLATRRPRAPGERRLWAAHVVGGRGRARVGGSQYETDRARFLGRGRGDPHADVGDRRPAAVEHGRRGARSDLQPAPPGAARRRARRARVAFSTLVAPSRERGARAGRQVPRPATFERAAHAGLDPGAGRSSTTSASSPTRRTSSSASPTAILYSDPTLRPSPRCSPRNERGPPALWAHGISGDLPIVLVRIDEADDLEIVRQLLRAHEYWRMKQPRGRPRHPQRAGARPTLRTCKASLEALRAGRASRVPAHRAETPRGGVFILLRADQHLRRVASLLQTRRARGRSLSRRGTLAEQVASASRSPPPEQSPPRRRRDARRAGAARACRRLSARSSSSSTAWAASPRTGAST